MFLDAYAGVGAVGIEALSRGASGVLFVDSSRTACRAIRRNLESLGIAETERIQVREGELVRALENADRARMDFDIVYLDPPYARTDLYEGDLDLLGNGPWLKEDGLVIAEHARVGDLPERAGRLVRVRVHPQGDSALTFYRWGSEWGKDRSN